jgi:hypothetical protein
LSVFHAELVDCADQVLDVGPQLGQLCSFPCPQLFELDDLLAQTHLDAIDAQTAIKVTDRSVEVISEGHWKQFNPTG